MRTGIKICGLTSPDEACLLRDLGVEYAGMVLFYPKSRRNITIEQAEEILAVLGKRGEDMSCGGISEDSREAAVKTVAVVVSPDAAQLARIAKAGFDYVQVHGEISDALMEEAQLPVWKAFNVSNMNTFPHFQGNVNVGGFVFDAAEPGSGKSFDWELLKGLPRDDKLFILAGGLHSGNVGEAIRTVRPDVVDVSSGVEYDDICRKGKDAAKIRAFVEAVRALG